MGETAEVGGFPEVIEAIAVGVCAGDGFEGDAAEERGAVVVDWVGDGGAVESDGGGGAAGEEADDGGGSAGAVVAGLEGVGSEVVEFEDIVDVDVAGAGAAALEEEELELVGFAGGEACEGHGDGWAVADGPEDVFEDIVIGGVSEIGEGGPAGDLGGGDDGDAGSGVVGEVDAADGAGSAVGADVEGVGEGAVEVEAFAGVATDEGSTGAAEERVAGGVGGVGAVGDFDAVRVVVVV